MQKYLTVELQDEGTIVRVSTASNDKLVFKAEGPMFTLNVQDLEKALKELKRFKKKEE